MNSETAKAIFSSEHEPAQSRVQPESSGSLDDAWFVQRMQLATDPYYEREFFTNLIYCVDRKKSIRDVVSVAVRELDYFGEDTDQSDRALWHLCCAYQASSELRESYQWLPIFQALFGLSLYRSDAKKPLAPRPVESVSPAAGKLEDFDFMIGKEARRVGSFEQAWGQLLYFLENRTQRSKACEVLISQAAKTESALTLGLLTKALDLSFASAWKRNAIFMKRAFKRFWQTQTVEAPHSYLQGKSLLTSTPELNFKSGVGQKMREDFLESFWTQLTQHSAEAAWESVREGTKQGASYEQWVRICHLVTGRILLVMKREQWPLVTDSIQYLSALESAGRWDPLNRAHHLATMVAELSSLSKKLPTELSHTRSAKDLAPVLSENMAKNQLVLRLDDACERGDREQSFALLKLILEDGGLTPSLCDRLLLMACKQDAWTFEMTTIPTAHFLMNAFQAVERLGLQSQLAQDAVFGLLRYLSDQREFSIAEARKRGDYGDGGLSKSTFDVSDGARILDRFVFNQVRNAQRIQIWPTEGKG